jgi:hypothetical protein
LLGLHGSGCIALRPFSVHSFGDFYDALEEREPRLCDDADYVEDGLKKRLDHGCAPFAETLPVAPNRDFIARIVAEITTDLRVRCA